ncbi:MAG: hypothetical protein HON47_04445 [Candidatus Diapherotrites archaeon]|jgi:hypothetical protein|uniref:Uncharacterized protein n=1 Tax=Candidatus Iainarchaeum sp. TaxID=3101447 RepID=A0A8T5GFS0_9ARCH|nr:hypothetical protein [Candidatus Diapherotrites archaeon]MBT7241374.1 hypothetical protein [Candidatus Diapherotrites archaeon]
MKGFATVLVAASVFVVAILLLSMSPAQDISYNSNFSELKIRISNYEILMLQMSQDCNWEKTITEINFCLDTSKQNISEILDMPYTSCIITGFNSNKDANTAIATLNCQTEIDSKKDGYFSNNLTKNIIVQKYD